VQVAHRILVVRAGGRIGYGPDEMPGRRADLPSEGFEPASLVDVAHHQYTSVGNTNERANELSNDGEKKVWDEEEKSKMDAASTTYGNYSGVSVIVIGPKG
jgi:hypothetical protein